MAAGNPGTPTGGLSDMLRSGWPFACHDCKLGWESEAEWHEHIATVHGTPEVRVAEKSAFDKWWLDADGVRLCAALDPNFSGVVDAARAAFEAGAASRQGDVDAVEEALAEVIDSWVYWREHGFGKSGVKADNAAVRAATARQIGRMLLGRAV